MKSRGNMTKYTPEELDDLAQRLKQIPINDLLIHMFDRIDQLEEEKAVAVEALDTIENYDDMGNKTTLKCLVRMRSIAKQALAKLKGGE